MYTTAGTTGVVLAVGGAIALLHRRLTDPALRALTTPGDVFNLLFFVAAFGLAGLGYLVRPAGAPGALAIVIGLLSWDLARPVPPLLGCGLAAVALLVAYIPLTHMSHFIAKYFTYHRVRWDDAPLAGNRRMAAAMASYLACRPTWAADHMKAGGAGTWAEIVSSNPAARGEAMTRRVRLSDLSQRAPEPLVDLESAALTPLPIPEPPPGRRQAARQAITARTDRLPRRRRACAGAASPGDAGRRRRAGRQVPRRAREALLPGEQLDVPAAAAPDRGALRPLPDVLGRVPHLRGKRPGRGLQADVPVGGVAQAVLPARPPRRPAVRLAARHDRVELAARRQARRARVPLQPVPPLRADVPDRRGQRPGGPRDPEALQPGTRHRAEGTACFGLDAADEGGVLDRHERRRSEGQRAVHRRGDGGEDRRGGRDAVGRRGRRRPAHPQCRGDPLVAREPGRLRPHPEPRGHLLDDVLRYRGVRRGQLRGVVRRRPVRPRRRFCTRRWRRS